MLSGSEIANTSPEDAMSIGIYMIGFIIVIIGLSIGAHMMHVPPAWIGVGVLVMVGLGLLSGVTHTRRRDPSE
ncbi:MAG TPA: hypothetical protein VHB50_21875 [Bryobacteraceae bacterium]|nr:hypothetical protein [Bryobacteraceae bacterium]